jgi:ubiquinone/menaquinone biosynthesis C-methylase UbiE
MRDHDDNYALDAAELGRNSAFGTTTSYLLGHADAEVQRLLLLQAHLYEQPTEQALRAAGLEPGMRVLDIGCGPGDVSLIAARLVGPTGRVIGIDASPDIVALARKRAVENGVTTVSFERSTVDDITLDEPVDAVIGRLILMHLPEPVAALRRLATLVRPGGVIAFCDFDMTAARSVPWLPTWETAAEAIASTFRGAGLDPQFGTTLHRLFRHAGLGTPTLTTSAPVGTAKDTEHAAYVANSWRLMLPVAERLGAVDPRLADPEALQSNLCNEIAAADGMAVLPALITAWTRR